MGFEGWFASVFLFIILPPKFQYLFLASFSWWSSGFVCFTLKPHCQQIWLPNSQTETGGRVQIWPGSAHIVFWTSAEDWWCERISLLLFVEHVHLVWRHKFSGITEKHHERSMRTCKIYLVLHTQTTLGAYNTTFIFSNGHVFAWKGTHSHLVAYAISMSFFFFEGMLYQCLYFS